MSFADAFRTCMSKYATFSGRARRSEYWFFYLAFILVYGILFGLASATGKPVLSVIAGLVVLAFVLPMIAATVRRLHDTGRSGWWYLIGLVPFVGGIVLLVFTCQDSVPGDNAWGPNPKGLEAFPAAPGAPYVGA
ncbi:DUF805 domain-containing protein [Oryzihumus sp.]|jgi:uncharacterized membrane protein YhaH (DUF805 family)|uniref:DUF805 domain-containing protein n=1 Tax=Oryzihumus sp. TaxID=1968903 RepID=UPI002ED8FCC2